MNFYSGVRVAQTISARGVGGSLVGEGVLKELRSDDLAIFLAASDSGTGLPEGIVLVRVDLGSCFVAQAVYLAADRVNTVLSAVAAQSASSPWRQRGWSVLVVDGTRVDTRWWASAEQLGSWRQSAELDAVGASLAERGSGIAKYVRRESIPSLIRDAVNAAEEAERSTARSAVLLFSQSFELSAAVAEMKEDGLIRDLFPTWSHARWRRPLVAAVRMSLNGIQTNDLGWSIITEQNGVESLDLKVALAHKSELIQFAEPGIVRSHVKDLLDTAFDAPRLAAELERIEELITVLADRRRRVRNALAHGNPVSHRLFPSAVTASRTIAQFGLQAAFNSLESGRTVQSEMSTIIQRGVRVVDKVKLGTNYYDYLDQST